MLADPATTSAADSETRRLYLLALIAATKHPSIHAHPTACQTDTQIAQVLVAELMTKPTISLAIKSLMQSCSKDAGSNRVVSREDLMNTSNEWRQRSGPLA